MQEEIGCLQDAIEALTKRDSCKRQYIRAGETLTTDKVSNLITAKEGSSCRDSNYLQRGCSQKGAAAVAARLGITLAPAK
jgi:hypothetical protein